MTLEERIQNSWDSCSVSCQYKKQLTVKSVYTKVLQKINKHQQLLLACLLSQAGIIVHGLDFVIIWFINGEELIKLNWLSRYKNKHS